MCVNTSVCVCVCVRFEVRVDSGQVSVAESLVQICECVSCALCVHCVHVCNQLCACVVCNCMCAWLVVRVV